MKRIFLSYHYDENGRKLADAVGELIKSHGLQVVTGQRLGGEPVADEIENRIAACDGLVCLLTQRDETLNSNWVRDERGIAVQSGKKVVAVVQAGVDDSGAYQHRERIEYDPNDPVPSILALSTTLWLWRSRSGRTLIAQVRPEEAVQSIMTHRGYSEVKYRRWNGGEHSGWHDDAKMKPVGNGIQLYIPGVQEAEEIELEVSNAQETWGSGAVSPVCHITLSRR